MPHAILSFLLLPLVAGFVVLAGPVLGQDFSISGDCTGMTIPVDLDFSCTGGRAEECALSRAIEAANGIRRCDRQIAAQTWIAATLTKVGKDCDLDCRARSRDIFIDAMKKFSKVPDWDARIRSAWAVGLSMSAAGEFDLAESINRKLKPDRRATVLAHGAWHAALRCKWAKRDELLEDAQTAADEAPGSAMKVRAYVWLARTYCWLSSRKAVAMMARARATLDALPPGSERRWSRVFYASELAAAGRKKEQDEILFGMGAAYDRALVLSSSAVVLGMFREIAGAKSAIESAAREVKQVKVASRRDYLRAVLAHARTLAGVPVDVGEISDGISVSRAYQRIADALSELRTGVYVRSCGDWK